MARSWFFPGRVTEASAEVLVNTGAASGFGTDPIDGDRGFVRLGQGRYEVPSWTIDRARRYSIAAYRSNPMARAIVDTYTAFVVGDSGVGYQCSNPEVRAVVDAWWTDPRNRIGEIQEQLFRDHFLLGETVVEHLVGDMTGVVRHSIIDPARVASVELRNGNPLWPGWLHFAGGDDIAPLEIVSVDDYTGLRTGRVSFFASNRALVTDRRGVPFLASIQDQLDAYDQVINNLVDRTALARYLVWDVTVDGEQDEIDEWIANRGGNQIPASGTVEVHNTSVTWKPQTVQTGAYEDIAMLGGVLTNVAAGAGLSKPWLADAEGANRATSQTMAEPVRRRVGSVQNVWLSYWTEVGRFVIDRAVAARRIPAMVDATDPASGLTTKVPASSTFRMTGPAIAAADTQVTATMLMNLGTALDNLVTSNVLSRDAAELAAAKAWEQFVGQPFRADLAVSPNDSVDTVATKVEEARRGIRRVS